MVKMRQEQAHSTIRNDYVSAINDLFEGVCCNSQENKITECHKYHESKTRNKCMK